MPKVDEIKEMLASNLPAGAQIEVWDLRQRHSVHAQTKQDHFGIRVVSSVFAGKGRLQQHRMVMDILKGEFGDEGIHAVQLKTLTPEKE